VTGQGQELFRMIRQGRLEWRAEVTSAELPRIQAGQSVQVVAASGAQVQGKVRLVGPTVDPQTRNALIYVDLPAHPQIKPGMFARGDFQLGASGRLTVPQQALVVRDGFNHVFVVGADQRVSRRKVEGRIGAGGARFEVHTVNGSASIDRGMPAAVAAPSDRPAAEAAPAPPAGRKKPPTWRSAGPRGADGSEVATVLYWKRCGAPWPPRRSPGADCRGAPGSASRSPAGHCSPSSTSPGRSRRSICGSTTGVISCAGRGRPPTASR